jgi:hypothetical protein
VLANNVTEAAFLANVHRHTEEYFAEQPAQEADDSDDNEETKDDESQTTSREDHPEDPDDILDVIDRSPASVWGTGEWLRPAGVKVSGTAVLCREGIEVELPDDEVVLKFRWAEISGWQGPPGSHPMTIFALGLRIQIATATADQWRKALNDEGVRERDS